MHGPMYIKFIEDLNYMAAKDLYHADIQHVQIGYTDNSS